MIFAFHPDINFERVIIERSFDHSFDKLTILDYLTRYQMQFLNRKTFLQMRGAAYKVSTRKDKLAISVIFNIKLKFAAQYLLKRFNAKIK